MTFSITSLFDSGNIEVAGSSPASSASSPQRIRLNIRKDAGGDHYQWFHFRVTGTGSAELVIENAAGASFVDGWEGYSACASVDREHWFRVPTRFDSGELIIEHSGEHDTVWYAYFTPYSYERHMRLVGSARRAQDTEVWVPGLSVDGRPLDVISTGTGDTPLWIIARQHPGESMAEWFVEGMLERLFDPAESLSKALLKEARLHIVPNMNPDGSVRGHLRNNAAGANLNREWETPTLERSPEVHFVRNAMDEKGLALCLDVHGDEALPYNFIAGPDGVAGLSDGVLAQVMRYEEVLMSRCPDFQMKHGYPKAPLGKANMTMATNQLAGRFDAPCMTLEQPFKDNADAPMPLVGWNADRAKNLGRAQLDALLDFVRNR